MKTDQTPDENRHNETDDSHKFKFPSNNESNRVHNYILFGVSVLFIPVLFLILIFQIKNLKENAPNKQDSLLLVIAKKEFKIDVNTNGSSKDPKIEIPPIRVEVENKNNSPKPAPRPYSKYNRVIQEIKSKFNCKLCYGDNYNLEPSIIKINSMMDTCNQKMKKFPDYDRLIILTERTQELISDDRIRFNANKRRTKNDSLSFLRESVKKIQIVIDSLSKKDIQATTLIKEFGEKRNSKKVFLEIAKTDSAFLTEARKLLLNSRSDNQIRIIEQGKNLAELLRIKDLFIELKAICKQFRAFRDQSNLTIDFIEAEMQDSMEIDDSKFTLLLQLLKDSSSLLDEVETKAEKIRTQRNNFLQKDFNEISCY